MSRFGRTPLAWKNLTHNLRRLAVAVSGVTFAVVLMFMERGFQNALFDSTVELVRNLDTQLVMINSSRYSLSSSSRFPVRKMALAESCRGVTAAHPLFIENYTATLRKPNFRSRPIRAIGFEVREKIFTKKLDRILEDYREVLMRPGTALIDVTSKQSIYTINPKLPSLAHPVDVELANQRLQLVGTFHLGTDFANDGTLFMSLGNFARFFPYRDTPREPLNTADLGLIVCEDTDNLEQLKKRVQAAVGKDVSVYSRDEFIRKEIRFWDKNTPIGVIFQVGMIMGFVVGVLICYQVLFNDISDHMAEFATLMAMGYSGRYFIGLVVREAIYLSLFGFVPGLGISWVLFKIITMATGLTMSLSIGSIGLILACTVVMCIVSGLLAVRKLLAADPASLF